VYGFKELFVVVISDELKQETKDFDAQCEKFK
jgi:hypothetical protein